MDWTNRNIHPSRVVQIGDDAQVMILDVDEDRRRISLGIKQCLPNPWEEFALTHAKSDRVAVGPHQVDYRFRDVHRSRRRASTGSSTSPIFRGTKTGRRCCSNHRKGEEIETVVLAVDAERERISLGIKQLDRDPFSAWLNDHPRGLGGRGHGLPTWSSAAPGSSLPKGWKGTSGRARSRANGWRMRVPCCGPGEIRGGQGRFRSIGAGAASRCPSRERESDEEATAMEQYAANVEDAPATIGDLVKEQMDRR